MNDHDLKLATSSVEAEALKAAELNRTAFNTFIIRIMELGNGLVRYNDQAASPEYQHAMEIMRGVFHAAVLNATMSLRVFEINSGHSCPEAREILLALIMEADKKAHELVANNAAVDAMLKGHKPKAEPSNLDEVLDYMVKDAIERHMGGGSDELKAN